MKAFEAIRALNAQVAAAAERAHTLPETNNAIISNLTRDARAARPSRLTSPALAREVFSSAYGPTTGDSRTRRCTGKKRRPNRAATRPHSPCGAHTMTTMATAPRTIRYQAP